MKGAIMARTQNAQNGNGLDVNPSVMFTVGKSNSPFEARWDDIPLGNRIALFRRATKHVLNNEAAASAVKLAEGSDYANIGTLEGDAKKAALEAWRTANAETWDSLLVSEAAKKWNMIMTGEMSADDRIRVDPVEKAFLTLVDNAIKAKLSGVKDSEGKAIRMPSNDSDVITFGNGQTRSREQLRQSIKDAQGEELMAKAREIVEMSKVAAPVAPPTDAVNDPAALGF
jgi:hypothetical protein